MYNVYAEEIVAEHLKKVVTTFSVSGESCGIQLLP